MPTSDSRSSTPSRRLHCESSQRTTGHWRRVPPSAAPRDDARFQQGAGAPEPTEQQLDALAATASTHADHRALEEYFLALAKRYAADAKDHAAMAQAYRSTRLGGAGVHCDRLVTISREAANEASAAAAMHKELAGIGR